MTDWTRIVNRHSDLVWQTAYRLLGRHDQAALCLRDTFLDALESSKRQRVRAWPDLLMSLCTAQAIRYLRKRLRHTPRLNGLAKWSDVPLSDSDSRLASQPLELSARPRLALTQLPPQQAQVLCLHYLSDLGLREIARQMGIKTSLVTVLLDRARSRLRELLSRTQWIGTSEQIEMFAHRQNVSLCADPILDRAVRVLRQVRVPPAPPAGTGPVPQADYRLPPVATGPNRLRNKITAWFF